MSSSTFPLTSSVCPTCDRSKLSNACLTKTGKPLCRRLSCSCVDGTANPITLQGVWIDDVRSRKVCLERDGVQERYTITGGGEIGIDYEDINKLVLKAPWGKGGSVRTWRGVVRDGGTTIVWDGVNGKSMWYKHSE